MPKHRLEVFNGEALSLSDLHKKKEDGHYIARTSHIGNQYLSNLVMLSAGFPAQLYDRNLIQIDENYWPSRIILNGKHETICQDGNVLTPFGRIYREGITPAVAKIINGYDNLANFHRKSLEEIYGRLISTESEFYLRQMEITEELSAIINFYYPEAFNRRITARGMTYSSTKHLGLNEFCRVNSNTINNLHDLTSGTDSPSFTSGLLPTLSAVLVINTVLASLSSNKDTVFELAGPDMAQYIYTDSRQNEINRIYATLADNFPGLPELLTLTIVPTFHCRFAALESELPKLDYLIKNLLQYRRISSEKKKILKEAKQNRKMTKTLQDELRILSEPLSNKAIALAGEMNKNPLTERLLSQDKLSEGGFFSHYDLLAAKEPLVISSLAMDFSMMECRSLLETLTQSKRMSSR